jgi:hypothetical protein
VPPTGSEGIRWGDEPRDLRGGLTTALASLAACLAHERGERRTLRSVHCVGVIALGEHDLDVLRCRQGSARLFVCDLPIRFGLADGHGFDVGSVVRVGGSEVAHCAPLSVWRGPFPRLQGEYMHKRLPCVKSARNPLCRQCLRLH